MSTLYYVLPVLSPSAVCCHAKEWRLAVPYMVHDMTAAITMSHLTYSQECRPGAWSNNASFEVELLAKTWMESLVRAQNRPRSPPHAPKLYMT